MLAHIINSPTPSCCTIIIIFSKLDYLIKDRTFFFVGGGGGGGGEFSSASTNGLNIVMTLKKVHLTGLVCPLLSWICGQFRTLMDVCTAWVYNRSTRVHTPYHGMEWSLSTFFLRCAGMW